MMRDASFVQYSNQSNQILSLPQADVDYNSQNLDDFLNDVFYNPNYNTAIALPVGTTAQQPTAVNGRIRYDSTLNKLRAVVDGSWTNIAVADDLVIALDDLTDVTITTVASGNLLRYNGSAWINTLLVAGDIPDLDTSKITSGTFVNARIAQSNVTQHQAALSITESQISDLQNYILTSEVGSVVQAYDNTLTALAGLDSTEGFLVQTGADTFTKRSITTVSPSRITIANGNGEFDNPSLDLASTAVTPGSYGLAGSVGQFTVDNYGRITSATNVAISITESQISDLGNYVPTSRQITIAGTSNQITVSAGSQDLSADRTWTLSLPTNLVVPGDLTITGGLFFVGDPTTIEAQNLEVSDPLLHGGVANPTDALDLGAYFSYNAGSTEKFSGLFRDTSDANKAWTFFDGLEVEPTTTVNTAGTGYALADLKFGTVRSGTWNGTAIGATYGGTGQSTVTTGDLLYGSASNVWSKLAAGSAGNILVVSGGIPSWSNTLPNNYTFSSTGAITIPVGTTGQRPSAANGMIRYNSTTTKLEGYENGAWSNLVTEGISGTVVANQVVYGGGAGTLTSSANMTWNGSTWALTGIGTITGSLSVDNLGFNGATVTAGSGNDLDFQSNGSFLFRPIGGATTLAQINSGGTFSLLATANQIVTGAGANLTTLNFPAPSGAVTLTFPNTTQTIATLAGTETFSNKTLTNPFISQIIGGTTTTSPITYKTTTGVGTTGADHIFVGGNNGGTEFMRILNNGNVGIGTSSPGTFNNDTRLAVVNSSIGTAIDLAGNGYCQLLLRDLSASSNNKVYELLNDSETFTISRLNDANSSRTTYLTISNTGALRLNTYGAGTLTTDAGGNVTATSDIRKKNLLGPIENGIDKVMMFDPQYYTWKPETGYDSLTTYMSLTAQSVKKADKLAVGKMPNGDLTVQDRAVIAILTKAIQEQQGTIQEQQDTIEELKKRVYNLERND